MSKSVNIGSIIRILGLLLLVEALLMLVPLIICLIYRESDWSGFAVAIAAAAASPGAAPLPESVTWHPARRNSIAMANPIPRVLPVITTFFILDPFASRAPPIKSGR